MGVKCSPAAVQFVMLYGAVMLRCSRVLAGYFYILFGEGSVQALLPLFNQPLCGCWVVGLSIPSETDMICKHFLPFQRLIPCHNLFKISFTWKAERDLIYWPTPQIPATVRAGSGWNQKPGFPTWVDARTWSITCCFPGWMLTGSFTWGQNQGLNPGILIWDVGTPSSILTSGPHVHTLHILKGHPRPPVHLSHWISLIPKFTFLSS